MLSNYFTPEQKPSDAIGLLKTKSACNLIVLKVPKYLILIFIDLARDKSKALADILTGYSNKKVLIKMLFEFTLFTLQNVVKNRIYYQYKLERGWGLY